eukprot:3806739-Rhodomonas_salina.3
MTRDFGAALDCKRAWGSRLSRKGLGTWAGGALSDEEGVDAGRVDDAEGVGHHVLRTELLAPDQRHAHCQPRRHTASTTARRTGADSARLLQTR